MQRAFPQASDVWPRCVQLFLAAKLLLAAQLFLAAQRGRDARGQLISTARLRPRVAASVYSGMRSKFR